MAEDPLCLDLDESMLNGESDDDPSCFVACKKPAKRSRIKYKNTPLSWSKTKQANFCTSASQQLERQPVSKGPACYVTNPGEAWNLLLDEPILNLVVRYTNEEIERRRHLNNFNNPSKTNKIEMRAWFGLSYLCGVFRATTIDGQVSELWSSEFGNVVFQVTMPFERFNFLTECIRLSSTGTNEESMRAVQLIWKKFFTNCRSFYSPSTNCAIGEYILGSSDPDCPFQFASSNQPNEIGFRLVTLCDTVTLYLYNALLANTSTANVLEVSALVCDIKNTQRNVVLTERHTSFRMAQQLAKYNLTMMGALPKDANGYPKALSSNKNISKFYANDASLTVGLDPNECPSGCLLTNGVPNNNDSRRLYVTARQTCQRFQQSCNKYNTKAAQPQQYNSWTLDLIQTLLNYAAMNACVLLNLSVKNGTALKQRDFLLQLGIHLTKQKLMENLKCSKMSLIHKLYISELLGEPTDKLLCTAAKLTAENTCVGAMFNEQLKMPDVVTLMPKTMDKRLRCRRCPVRSCIVRTRCQQCSYPLCSRHLISRCYKCTGLPVDESVRERPTTNV